MGRKYQPKVDFQPGEEAVAVAKELQKEESLLSDTQLDIPSCF